MIMYSGCITVETLNAEFLLFSKTFLLVTLAEPSGGLDGTVK
jgi:hypothetical protein